MKNNEFIPPIREIVIDKEYMEKLCEVALKKDLSENEEVCSFCHGTGLVISDNVYGIHGDPNKQFGMFPYKNQSVNFCPRCYNGVVRRCKLCGEIMDRGVLRHNCEEQQKIDKQELEEKREQRFNEAQLISIEEAGKYFYLYSEDISFNQGFFSNWDEFFEAWENESQLKKNKPLYVYVTEPEELHIDMTNVIENACEDLGDDAVDQIDWNAVKQLQQIVDNWCKKDSGVSKYYYPNYNYKVKIPWAAYNELKK